MPVTVIIALILTTLVALFSLQNAQQVQVTFFSWYFQGSLVVVILLAFALGLTTTALLSVPGRFKKAREVAECRKRIKALEKEKAAAEQRGGTLRPPAAPAGLPAAGHPGAGR